MKTSNGCRFAVLASLAWIPVSAVCASLVNGSFESGLDAWEWGGNVTVQSAAPYAPTDGSSLVAFNAMNLPPNGWIRQNVEVVPGRDHELAFDIGNLGYTDRYQRMRIEVTEDTLDGTVVLLDHLVPIPGTTGGATVWSPLKGLAFTPQTSHVTVVFRDDSASSGGLDLVLDNVRLTKSTTFVEVTTDQDENDGALGLGEGNSLRELLEYVSSHPEVDEIRFSMALPGTVIMLQHGELEMRTPVAINGRESVGHVTIDAAGFSRVMHIFCNGEASLRGLTLRGGASAGAGGGLLVDSGPEMTSHPVLKTEDCVIEDNRSADSGGGVALRRGDFEFTRTRVLRNRAALDGGGVSASILMIVNFDGCEISENRACGAGGGLQANLCKVNVMNSTLSGNRAGGIGGAITSHAEGAPYKNGWLILKNSTLVDNHSLDAGPALHSVGSSSLVHCTVMGNHNSISGAIHAASGSLHLLNSIVTPYPDGGEAVSGVFPILEGGNWLDGDPSLAPLADFGGSTPTMPPLPGSPVIDAGEAVPGIPATDQRGGPRPSGPLPDLGAVEAFPLSALQPAVDEDGDGIDDRLEPAYGLTVGVDDRLCDSDQDGQCDRLEIANMTDPRDPASRFGIEGFAKAETFDADLNPEFGFWFRSFPGLNYSVECDQSPDFSPLTRRELSLGPAVDHATHVKLKLAPQRDFVRVRRDP